MNKTEKELAKKLKAFYSSPSKNGAGFTREENLILEHWRALGILNEDAFYDMTAMNSDHKEYIQCRDYPFTSSGEDEVKKNWYLHFRDSKSVIIVRDVFAAISFLVALYVAISELFQ
jgi:hypothetical protein